MRAIVAPLVGALCACSTAIGTTGTVTLTIDSTKDGLVVQPGHTIDWSIEFTVSTGDNDGLAGVSVDLIQNKSNPVKLVLTPSTTTPAGMSGFARPSGISNPTVNSIPGFRGTPLGSECEKNLFQIGGAQNIFGVAGSAIGTDTTVDPGVGQSGAQVLASGSFAAPSARGVYVFVLQNAAATVLTDINTAPTASVADAAEVEFDPAGFTVIVCPGDANGNGTVDITDSALILAAFGACTGQVGYSAALDLNSSGCIDGTDLAIVLANFGAVCTE